MLTTWRNLIAVGLLVLCVPQVRADDQPPPALPVQLGVSEVTVQSLAVPAAPGVFAVQVVLGGAVVDLVLEPVSLRAPGFSVMVDDGAGPQAVDAPVEMNFAGSAIGRPGLAARFSVVGGSWRGEIDPGDGGAVWWVQPVRDALPAGGERADLHAVYSGISVLPGSHTCGGVVETGTVQSGALAKGAPVSCGRTVEIAFDADVLFYGQNGSNVAATNADIDSIVNAMNLIYARDVGISFVVTRYVVRTSAGLYTSASTSVLLSQMAAEWNANQTTAVRDVAHLMTGQPTGTNIGLAYGSVVCNIGFGYGVSQSRFSANFANRVALTAHEVGHNFSATHCDADADCGIMCSINNGCAHNVGAFGTRAIGEIRPYALAAACLAGNGGFGPAVPPHAVPDAATCAPGGYIDLDLLANDFDGNCQTITIQTFPASTAKGTLTRLIGAGPGGRDLVRYSAGAASVGADTWSYTIADTTAAVSIASVVVTIPAPKVPDYAGPTRTQLDGSYYRLSGRAAVPDFGPLFNFRTNTYTNHNGSFPSTTGEFEQSGRSDYFASVTTATLTVPTAGSWTFFTTSDEGSLFYIDGVLVVNNDFVHTAIERSGVIASLSAGSHALRIEHFELTGACEVTARWQGPGVAKQVIPATRLTNLQLRFYELPPALTALPVFSGMVPIATATTPNINFVSSTGNFGASARPGDVGAVFTGLVSAPTSGLYTFFLESDDGSRLTLGDSQVVVNNDGAHTMLEVGGQISLLAGLHTLKVEYFNGSTPSGLIARWQGPGIAKAVIPAANLFRLPAPCNSADLGRQGGVNGPDGLLDNNDFIVFINYFFGQNPLADVGVQGGVAGSDGVYDNNDFVAYINAFFAPCN
ncbi:MAG: PA14 domain-containing protein [Phycisphaerales bacterium]|nr:PA14 domain-containing protein [Phycisphaerales bacterium]